jgi:hypothetical protein
MTYDRKDQNIPEALFNIPMDQQFNDALMAYGPRVDGIQAVLPEHVRQGLVTAPKFTSEGSGSWLLSCRSERRNVIEPGLQAAESRLKQVSEIAALFA